MLVYSETKIPNRKTLWDKHVIEIPKEMYSEFEEKNRREIGYNWRDELTIHLVDMDVSGATTAPFSAISRDVRHLGLSGVWEMLGTYTVGDILDADFEFEIDGDEKYI